MVNENHTEHGRPRGDEVQVWLLETGPALSCFDEFRLLLSPAERDRAAAFARESSARCFIAARGFLRLLLGRALGLPPAGIEFAYGPTGKPRLADPFPLLAFNLSHTAGLAAFALSAGKEVGIDVETIAEQRDLAGIADYVFPAATARRLAALPAGERLPRFYELWTRFEAAAKASGVGLGAINGLAAADLESASPLALDFNGATWTIVDLPLPPALGLAGSVCQSGSACRTRLLWAEPAAIHEMYANRCV